MSGTLRPGQRIKLADLCEEYGVSLSVVREAATRLAEQGLFRAEPNRGFRVASLSIDDLKDLTLVRIEVETMCLRRSIELGDTAWEAGVVAAHHVLRAAARISEDTPETDLIRTDAHSNYHAALASGCQSPRLVEIRQSLFDAAELYRHWSVNASSVDRDPPAEHLGIMEAALERDADLAAERLVAHIRGTQDWLLTSAVASNGEGLGVPETAAG
jgi:DNA-binding GntR family transcriptional regulator